MAKQTGGEVGEYTPGLVWTILTEGTDDQDALIDIQVGLGRLPRVQQTFLVLLSAGYSISDAMRKIGETANQSRYTSEAIMALTKEINGDGDERAA